MRFCILLPERENLEIERFDISVSWRVFGKTTIITTRQLLYLGRSVNFTRDIGRVTIST